MDKTVLQKINHERKKQNTKWGIQDHDSFVWLAILTEEVGELAESILHNQFGGDHAGTHEKELVHVVAVGIQWLERLQADDG